MRTAILLFALAARLAAQEDDPTDEEVAAMNRAGKVVIDDPGVKIEDAKVAREKVRRFADAFKQAGDTEKQVALLEELGGWDHPEILKAAGKLVTSSDRLVAVAAVVVCGRQTDSKAGPLLMKALRREEREDVVCALLVALGKTKTEHASIRKIAEDCLKRDAKDRHLAAVRYFGLVGDKAAFRMIAEKLDRPRPADVNSDTNPPASYWRERWVEWKANLPYVREALSNIVPGETFETTREAEMWAKSSGKALGITWD